jgi:DNA-binding transcriptional regulator YiaG
MCTVSAGLLAGQTGKGCWAVAEQLAPSFAVVLRQLRTAAGLTQEELAETARISVRSVSDLERG